MKCVKYLDTGEMRRLTDDNARKLVRDGKAVFVSKSTYKRGSEEVKS